MVPVHTAPHLSLEAGTLAVSGARHDDQFGGAGRPGSTADHLHTGGRLHRAGSVDGDEGLRDALLPDDPEDFDVAREVLLLDAVVQHRVDA
jgi:hypothetical protein